MIPFARTVFSNRTRNDSDETILHGYIRKESTQVQRSEASLL
jgi:hypothetical protein